MRIWYSVCGEGMGHALRSKTIITELQKKHDILITAAARSYPYLKEHFENVHEILGNTYVFKDNKVLLPRSVLKFFWHLPRQIIHNIRVINPLLKSFKPDLIICDFESAAHYFAKVKKIPCISIDNIHVLTDCKTIPKIPWHFKTAARILHPKSNLRLIPAFADATPYDETTKLMSPIIRPEVQALQPEDHKHVLVYQTTATNTKMIKILKQHKRTFHIYGMLSSDQGSLIRSSAKRKKLKRLQEMPCTH